MRAAAVLSYTQHEPRKSNYQVALNEWGALTSEAKTSWSQCEKAFVAAMYEALLSAPGATKTGAVSLTQRIHRHTLLCTLSTLVPILAHRSRICPVINPNITHTNRQHTGAHARLELERGTCFLLSYAVLSCTCRFCMVGMYTSCSLVLHGVK